MSTKAKSSAERMRAHRRRMRERGYKLKQVWVPDVNDPAFREEIRQQSIRASQSPAEKEIMDWIEAVQADMDWDR